MSDVDVVGALRRRLRELEGDLETQKRKTDAAHDERDRFRAWLSAIVVKTSGKASGLASQALNSKLWPEGRPATSNHHGPVDESED